MIKYFCDRCGKETDSTHICEVCEYEELTYGFKVGDQVITDDGRVGTIVDICDCESCKKRGFYEPRVDMTIGEYQIYITDKDKRNGFQNFYKIGDQVFGNIDEQYVLNNIEYKKKDISDMQRELMQLEAQLNVIQTLKKG